MGGCESQTFFWIFFGRLLDPCSERGNSGLGALTASRNSNCLLRFPAGRAVTEGDRLPIKSMATGVGALQLHS
jgi:hypothetical protein